MRVLVAEDEKKVASLIEAGLVENGFTVVTCHHGDEATRLATTESFDAIILDIMLPGRDGLSILRKLRAENHTLPVILVTARGDVQERIDGLNLGADDYLPKPFSVIELIARLRSVLRRRQGTGLTLQIYADLSVNLVTRQVTRGETVIDLSNREYTLLEFLIRRPERPVTRVEIKQTVWGHQFDAGTNFVDVAVQRLRRKIDDPFPVKLLQTVRGLGYMLHRGSGTGK